MYTRIALATLLLAGVVPASAHDEDLRSPNLKPRIGTMSEEVVREKFRSYGVNLLDVRKQDGSYTVRAEVGGAPTDLVLDAVTGRFQKAGTPFLLEAAPAANLVIRPNAQRVRWVERTIRFERIGVEGLREEPSPEHEPVR